MPAEGVDCHLVFGSPRRLRGETVAFFRPEAGPEPGPLATADPKRGGPGTRRPFPPASPPPSPPASPPPSPPASPPPSPAPSPPASVVTLDGSEVTAAFDPTATLAYYLDEGYLPTPRRPWTTRLPFHHHLLPGACRRLAGQILSYLDARRRPPPQGYYPAWPKEPAVAAIQRALEGRRVSPRRPAPTQPAGSGPPAGPGFCLTHDVDTAHGQRLAGRMAEIEAKAGLVSTWFFVPRHYRLDRRLLAELKAAGHEIGCHGYDHSGGLPFEPPAGIRRQLEAVRPFCREHGVVGFRSPGLLRTKNLFALLPDYFKYDSSVPDTEMYTGAGWRNGCACVVPFARGGLWEIPITLPLDAALIHYGYRPSRILALWLDKAAWLASLGGLIVVDTHPEPHYSGNRPMLHVYQELLEGLKVLGPPAGTLAGVVAARDKEGWAAGDREGLKWPKLTQA